MTPLARLAQSVGGLKSQQGILRKRLSTVEFTTRLTMFSLACFYFTVIIGYFME